MPSFNPSPSDDNSRKMLEQRFREATRPAAPEQKGGWRFCDDKQSLLFKQNAFRQPLRTKKNFQIDASSLCMGGRREDQRVK